METNACAPIACFATAARRQGLGHVIRDSGTVPLTHRVIRMSNIDAARDRMLRRGANLL
jgi:hypothetical protein